MKRIKKLLVAVIAAAAWISAFADVSIDTPTPTSCTYKRSGFATVTIQGGSAAQCDAAALADANSRAIVGTATYTFTAARTAHITYTAAPVVCPPTPPADVVRQQACQAPLYGTFPQSQGWTLHPTPTCWVNDGTLTPSSGSVPPCSTTPPAGGFYTTTFAATEDPISESGKWIGGKTVGLAWSDFSSTPGLAIGKQNGWSNAVYDDSVALLTGTWGPNQTVEAVVKTVNQNTTIWEELEIRLRSTLTPNSSTGYECNFSARSTATAYVQIVKWNGPLGSFTEVDGREGIAYALHNGDTIKCTISGSTITAYINGVQKLQVSDSAFTSGAPGIGAFLQNASGVNADYGFTSFTATSN